MWKLKVSKYRNSTPKIPRKEDWISDVSTSNILNSCGNHIKASAAYMAFNLDTGGGGVVGILPLDDKGRKEKLIPVLHAHAELTTDMDFSPFDDFLLATGSQDCTVKIWSLPEGGLTESISNAEVSLPPYERRIENVLWNPAAQNVIGASSHDSIYVWDVEQKQEKYALGGHEDLIQSFTWKGDGSLVASSCKDKKLRLFDPRAGTAAQETEGHKNVKDSRIIWLGEKDTLLTTGFSEMRERQIALWDARNFTTPLEMTAIDQSMGTLMPLFDPDTSMLFTPGKADRNLAFFEVSDANKVTLGARDVVEQIKGAALVPKRALNVMEGEVNRVILLAKKCIIPVPYIVPRKTYRDFHQDVFPDTFTGDASMTAEEWFAGQNKPLAKMSLDPAKRPHVGPKRSSTRGGATVAPPAAAVNVETKNEAPAAAQNIPAPAQTVITKEPVAQNQSTSNESKTVNGGSSSSQQNKSSPPAEPVAPSTGTASKPETSQRHPGAVFGQKKHTVFSGVRQSKFRHLKGTPLHKNFHFENIRNLSMSMPGESDAFAVNPTLIAVPLAGSGGLISVLQVSSPGRQPDTGIPTLQNHAHVTDFSFDPFDDHRLAVACDDARIRLWRIPEGGLTETLEEPEENLLGHNEKIYFVRWHPLARDVLASASYDMTVIIWDTTTGDQKYVLQGHTDTIFNLAWSPDGSQCATVCKDGKIRIYSPRESVSPIKVGCGPPGSRGARVVWVCHGKYLLVSGFDKQSGRTLYLYDVNDITETIADHTVDISPAILIPDYDEDSSTVFLTGRGDTTIHAFEVSDESPHLFQLSNYCAGTLHQALALLPKTLCDVKSIEFAKGYRLTKNSIEPISFTVPRIKKSFFQDDLFPDTKVTTEASMSAAEWFSGENKPLRTISLRPEGLEPLSAAPAEAPKPKKYQSYNEDTFKTDEQKKEELLSAMLGKMDKDDGPLPQDLTEGCDDDEWDD